MRFFTLAVFCIYSLNVLAQSSFDTDQDGMPDNWEVENNLNPNDPTDAWLDNDGNQVFNLYEFQLQSNPNDSNEPNIVEFTVNDDFESTMDVIPNGSVIRFASGTYAFNYSHSLFLEISKVMIQGGWNAEFTDYDPCTNKVVLDGNGAEDIFDFSVFESNGGNVATAIVEGIEFTNSSGHAFNADGFVDTLYVSVNNCTFHNNQADWFGSVLNISDGTETKFAFIQITDTYIFNNKGTGLEIALFAVDGTIQSYNNTVALNQQTPNDEGELRAGFGIELQYLSDSITNMTIQNTISWGNGDNDLSFFIGDGGLELISSNNNFGSVDAIFDSYSYIPGEGDISADPLFVDTTNNNFTLMENSPSNNTGLFLGLPGQLEGDVDMGPNACPSTVSSIFSYPKITNDLKLYPTVNNGRFTLAFDLDKSSILSWEVISLQGQHLTSGQIYANSGYNEHPVSLNNIAMSPGMYFVNIYGKDSYMTSKMYIQR